MPQKTLEQRVAALERQISRLSKRLLPGQKRPADKDWRSTLGMFANDSIMKKIDEEGRKIRQKDRRRARS